MVGSVLGLGSFFLDIASKLYPDSKDIGTAAKAAGQVVHSYNVISTTSVHQSANKALIAPIVGVEAGMLHQEFMADLMQIIQLRDVVATLTHLALQGSLGLGVRVENVIGSINPNRGGMLSLAGCEALNDHVPRFRTGNEDKPVEGDEKPLPNVNYVSVAGKQLQDVQEYTPLAVGKIVNATLHTEAGGTVEFPLTFRQIPLPIQSKDLKRIFSAAKAEDGLAIRWMMAKTTEITYPEFLSGKDIVKERFRIKNEEMSGYYKEALARETGNRAAAIRTGVVSMNSLANSFIISSDSANQLEMDIGRRFSDAKSRRDIFKAVKANTIVVCNEDRGIFTFYTHGQDMAEQYTRKDIAVKSKKDTGATNLADLVKLLNGGM